MGTVINRNWLVIGCVYMALFAMAHQGIREAALEMAKFFVEDRSSVVELAYEYGHEVYQQSKPGDNIAFRIKTATNQDPNFTETKNYFAKGNLAHNAQAKPLAMALKVSSAQDNLL